MSELTIVEWENFIQRIPDAHLLQTGAWGSLKSSFGWKPVYLASGLSTTGAEIGAQILFRRLPLGFSLAYIPKGPLGSGDWKSFWTVVDRKCHALKAIFLKVELDQSVAPASASAEIDGRQSLRAFGFRESPQSIQPRRTLVVDLTGSEELILSRMKQKTRYNIRLAGKHGVLAHTTSDVSAFYRLMQTTGNRDAFGVHSQAYYQRAYDLFHPAGQCELFLAEYESEPLAGLMVFLRGSRAWYFYGASSDERRELMPAYLLQWEAMRWAKAQGCTQYDLWGIPDLDEEQLEANFATQSGGLWGVYRFKRGFGGQLVRTEATWDRVYHPWLYRLYLYWYGRRRVD